MIFGIKKSLELKSDGKVEWTLYLQTNAPDKG